MSFTVGATVGPYQIVQKLGQGGMATVYKAYHTALDRHVAIKVLHPTYTENDSFLRRFAREAKVVARLEHPHIVAVYDYAEHEGYPYLVMRYVEGETLKERLGLGALSRSEILRIGTAVAEALDYAHAQGVLHRDIKPSNILLTTGSGVYLTDFGLARMTQAGESTLSQDMIMGTPQYISPEQAKGAPNLDGRTDVYSFGIVLYEMIVGRVPFQADTSYAVIHAQIFDAPPPPSSLNNQVGPALEAVLLKALAKEPDERYHTAGELMAAFRQAAAELPTDVAKRPGAELLPDYTPLAMTKVEVLAAKQTAESSDTGSIAKTAVPPLPDLSQTPNTTTEAVAQPISQRPPFLLIGVSVLAGMVLCACIFFAISAMQQRRNPNPPGTPVAQTPEDEEFAPAGTVVAAAGTAVESEAAAEAPADNPPEATATSLPEATDSLPAFVPPAGDIHSIEEIEHLLDADPGSLSLKAELALALLQNGRVDEARAIVQEVFRRNRFPAVYILAGERLMEAERFELAALVLEEGYQQFSDNTPIQQLLMMSLILGRQPSRLIQVLVNSLHENGDSSSQTTIQIGEAYLAAQEDQIEQGLEILTQAQETAGSPYIADILFLKGIAFAGLDNIPDARTAFEMALSHDPDPWLVIQIEKHLAELPE